MAFEHVRPISTKELTSVVSQDSLNAILNFGIPILFWTIYTTILTVFGCVTMCVPKFSKYRFLQNNSISYFAGLFENVMAIHL